MRKDKYTLEMAEKLVAKLRSDPEGVFVALGKLEEMARTQVELHRTSDRAAAMAFHEAARAINVVREWVPSW